jgi:hypothetical protein
VRVIFRVEIEAPRAEIQEALDRKGFMQKGADFEQFADVLELGDLIQDFEYDSTCEEILPDEPAAKKKAKR